MPNIWSNLGIDQDVPEPNLDDPITINLMQNIGEFFTGFFIGKTFCDATFRQATKGVFLGPKVVPKAYRNIALLLPVFLPVFIRVIQNLSLSEDFDAGHVLNIVGDALFFSNVVPRAQTDFHNELDRMRRHLGYDPGTTDLQILRAVIRIGPEKFGEYFDSETKKVTPKTIDNRLARWRKMFTMAESIGIPNVWKIPNRSPKPKGPRPGTHHIKLPRFASHKLQPERSRVIGPKAEIGDVAHIEKIIQRLENCKTKNTARSRKNTYRIFDTWAMTQGVPPGHTFKELCRRGQPMLDEFRAAQKAAGYSLNTIHIRTGDLSRLISDARRDGLCNWKPKNVWSTRGKKLVRDTSGVTRDDINMAITKLRGEIAKEPKLESRNLRNIAIVQVLSRCGVRASDAADLLIEDIDFKNGSINLYDVKHGEKRSTNLDATTANAIRDYLAVDPHIGALFLKIDNAEAMSSNAIQMVVRRLNLPRIISGATAGAHALRHTAATEVYRATDGDIGAVASKLGHTDASARSTADYIP